MATSESKPDRIALREDNIPRELRQRHQWVCWAYEWENNRWTKVPRQPSGPKADSTNGSTWSTFHNCLQAFVTKRFDGIGFVTSQHDPYVLIDLDDARDPESSVVEPWARIVLDIAHRERGYIEVSTSGTGFHVIGRGEQGFAGTRRNNVELYCRDRYFAMTGHVWTP